MDATPEMGFSVKFFPGTWPSSVRLIASFFIFTFFCSTGKEIAGTDGAVAISAFSSGAFTGLTTSDCLVYFIRSCTA